MESIKVFGDKAKEIKNGQVFIAQVGSVEGRTVVTLVPDNDYWERQDNPERYEEQMAESNQREYEERDAELDCINHEDGLDDSFIDMDGDEALERGFDEDEMRSEAMLESTQ